LVGSLFASAASEGFSPALVQHEVHVRFERRDIRIERLGGRDRAVRVTHNPSGIVAEANAYATERDNERAALQGLALKLRALEEERAARDR
jgi:protein subunit release factor A